MSTIVIMPGGFHPFHAGHAALYNSIQRAFPSAEVFVAATNDTSARPFPFAVKEKLAKLAGVEPGHFVQVKSPFRAEEITSRFNPEQDRLIFVRSKKDQDKQPLPGGVKKNGEPSYLQPLMGAKKLKSFNQHAYMAYLPTVEFGPGMTSATEIRNAWPKLNEKRKQALVMSLYPTTQSNPRLAANVVKMLDTAMGAELNEFAPPGGAPGGGNYFQALASAWYNGAFDTGSLQKGIKSKEDVERLLQRGIVCPDGVTRKFGIDYNAEFDGVVISSDDYYEHSDHGKKPGTMIDVRTGQAWGPYDYMEFSDDELDESLTEFAPTRPPTGGGGGPKDYGQPTSSRYLGNNKFVVGTTNNYVLTATVDKWGLEWDEDDEIWYLDSPGAVYIADATEGEIELPAPQEQRNQIHDLVSDYLNARNSAELQRVAAYYGHSNDGEMSSTLDEMDAQNFVGGMTAGYQRRENQPVSENTAPNPQVNLTPNFPNYSTLIGEFVGIKKNRVLFRIVSAELKPGQGETEKIFRAMSTNTPIGIEISRVKNRAVLENAEKEFILYIDGKPASKYVDQQLAVLDMAAVRKKYPAARLELKHEVCDMQTVKQINEGGSILEVLKPDAFNALQQAKQRIEQNRQQEVDQWAQDFRANSSKLAGQQLRQRVSPPPVPVARPGEKHAVLQNRITQLDLAIDKQQQLDALTQKLEHKGLLTPAMQMDFDTRMYVRDAAADDYQALNQKLDRAIALATNRLRTNKLAFKEDPDYIEEGRKI